MSKFTFSFDKVLSRILKRDVKKIINLFVLKTKKTLAEIMAKSYVKAKEVISGKVSECHVSLAVKHENFLRNKF